ncbi:hypothetical protein ColTof4_14016 [Colletotrichum tofieldiae]|nr:hypothetical protein ColTof3_14650 [Colletotrichum tofieldiae]GKT81593.1 hypothetical protein ColTof4_14016 [Colletotrichum tofieldiae]
MERSGVIDSIAEGLTPSQFIFPYGEDIQDGVSYLCAAPARAVASSYGDIAAGIIAEAFAGGFQGHFGPKDTTWDSFWDGTKEAAASMSKQVDQYLDRVTDNVLMLFREARTLRKDLS